MNEDYAPPEPFRLTAEPCRANTDGLFIHEPAERLIASVTKPDAPCTHEEIAEIYGWLGYGPTPEAQA